MRTFTRRALPLIALASGACFATQSDLRVVQTDLQSLRVERARLDSLTQQRLAEVVAALAAATDSVGVLGARVMRMQGDVRGDMFAMTQQLLQIQELTGQSQRRLQELRASLEARQQELAAQVAAPPAAAGTTQDSAARPPAPPPGPGPHQLFQSSLDQLRRGSAASARAGFEELLRQYPTAEVAGEAQFYLAEALRAEGRADAADSAYAASVRRFPTSPRAPTALYKRALLLQEKGNNTAARATLNELIRAYPRSDEATLARDRLRATP